MADHSWRQKVILTNFTKLKSYQNMFSDATEVKSEINKTKEVTIYLSIIHSNTYQERNHKRNQNENVKICEIFLKQYLELQKFVSEKPKH